MKSDIFVDADMNTAITVHIDRMELDDVYGLYASKVMDKVVDEIAKVAIRKHSANIVRGLSIEQLTKRAIARFVDILSKEDAKCNR